MNRAPTPAARAALALVRGYQKFISRPLHFLLGPWCGCRFTPTCSEYARQAFLTHGFLRGGWLAALRLARCNPWFKGGVDEVPPPKAKPPKTPQPPKASPHPQPPAPAPVLAVITGVTAVGKTAYAIERALATNAEIVSCDSLLVYRGMDIGTAKPTAAERAAVPHHCLDLVEPDAPYSIYNYTADASAAVRDILSRSKNVIVTGGSGFYLKAFYRAVTDNILISDDVAAHVREISARGLESLQTALLPFAPSRPDFIDWQNPRRLAKALERCIASGKPLAEIHAEFQNTPGAFDGFAKHTVLLERAPEALAERITRRVRGMLDAGLVDEVRALRDAGKLPPASMGASATGYRETLAWLETGNGDTAALQEAIVVSTRQLAAKQRKWFRTQIAHDEVIHL